MRRAILTGITLGAFFLASASGCRATVAGDPDRPIKIEAHVTIDIRQIKEEAHSIEDLVSGGAKGAPKPHSMLWEGWVRTAWAQPLEMTPELQQAIDSRKERYAKVKEFKAQGAIGEDNQGHVAALGGGAEVETLAVEENRDRETIYAAQAKQKGLPPDEIGTIRSAFAEEQRDRAEPGEKIQFPSGEWATK